jgi:hypothetical protein
MSESPPAPEQEVMLWYENVVKPVARAIRAHVQV